MKLTLRIGDGARLLDPANDQWSPSSDFELCLNHNRFNFILKIEKGKDYNYLKKIQVDEAL
jgi:2-phosphosulfolactate phosphatase